jgi:hypothetical protein
MEYKVVSDKCVLRIMEDGAVSSIPVDEGNADYQQYLVDTDGGLPLPKETKEDK